MLTAWAITRNGNIDLRHIHAQKIVLQVAWLIIEGHLPSTHLESSQPPLTTMQADNLFDHHRAGTGIDAVEVVVTRRYESG